MVTHVYQYDEYNHNMSYPFILSVFVDGKLRNYKPPYLAIIGSSNSTLEAS